MNIRNGKEIRSFAAGRLENARNNSKIVLIYAALTLGSSVLVTLVNYVLGLQMEGLSGLSSFGKRNMLSSIRTLLPIALSLFSMCLDTGYLAAMLRMARGQYTSEQTLRLGFDRFWLLLRVSIFKAIRYTMTMFLCIYAGVMLFLVLPVSRPAMEVLAPYLAEMSALSGELVLDEVGYMQFAQAVWPAYVICGIFAAAVMVPLWYSYRMTGYIVIDKPGMRAMQILRESKQMMRKNRLSLLKLDLGYWWYHLLILLARVVCYGDAILPLLGVRLPGNGDVWYFVFMTLYYAILFAAFYFFRSRVEVGYALAYDAVKPEEPKDNGVVLGNIFQM